MDRQPDIGMREGHVHDGLGAEPGPAAAGKKITVLCVIYKITYE